MIGYHSLRIMGSTGPDFNESLVRKDGTIWPLGKVGQYPLPVVRYGKSEFRSINEMTAF